VLRRKSRSRRGGSKEEGREGGREEEDVPSSLICLCQRYFSLNNSFIWSLTQAEREGGREEWK